MTQTLGDAFVAEVQRLEELMIEYKNIGPAGQFGYTMIEQIYKEAKHVWNQQDTVGMIRLYPRMKECQ